MARMGATDPMVKGSALLVPPAVVTVINCGPNGAPGKMVKVADTDEGFAVTPDAVMYAPALMVARSRLDPRIVTPKVEFNKPLGGRICEISGGGAETVNGMGPLNSPPGETTPRFIGPVGAVTEMLSEAVMRLGVVVMLVTVTPGIGMIVAPVRLNPLIEYVAELPW